MKYSITFGLFFLLSTASYAQSKTHFSGDFKGQIRTGGFIDLLTFKRNRLIVQKNEAYGYGVIHTYVYRITYLPNDLIYFKQVRHRIKGSFKSGGSKGELHNKKIKMIRLKNGNIQFQRGSPRTNKSLELKRI